MTAAPDPGARLAEELSLLVAAVAERAGPWLDRVLAGGHEEHEVPAARGWCPLCAVLSLLRGDPGAAAAHGLDRLADLVALLRAVLADRWHPDEPPHMPGFRPPEPAPAPSPRVQRVPVRRRGGPAAGA